MNAVRKAARVTGAAIAAATVLVGSWGITRSNAGHSDAPLVPSAAIASRAAIASVPALSAPIASAQAIRVPIAPPRFASAAAAAAESPALSTPSDWREPSGEMTRVVLVGDSLALEASQLVAYLTAPKEFGAMYFGGTAPCDWVDADLHADPTTVVVISFTGNSMTPCMSDGAGGFLVHGALAARYRADIETLINRSRQAGARVVLVGQPQHAPEYNDQDRVDAINGMFRQFAASWAGVSFVDAGAAVETPSGEYTDRLPCTWFDDDCASDGTTIVRGDGLHFCPIVGIPPCAVHSSGALRFSLAISGAANNPVAFD
jgi:hypothetical protein